MTAQSNKPWVANGQAGSPTLTGLKQPPTPAAAAAQSRELTKQLTGNELHKAFDQMSNQLLCSLGYSEFVDAFVAATEGYHT